MHNLEDLQSSIKKACEYQLGLQTREGYWWYTLEANETICAESIFLKRFIGDRDPDMEAGLTKRILSRQRKDGTWGLYWNAKPDLSTTIECYWALKIAGYDINRPNMQLARDFVLQNGGLTHARVFTKIHLAMFGLAPWCSCPTLPPELMLMPIWAPVNIYEFSSWARATIVPLMIIMKKQPVRSLQTADGKPFALDELFVSPPDRRAWKFTTDKPLISWERFFIGLDKILKITERIPFCPFDAPALKKCEEWICKHIAKTEDIFPALAYGAIALSSLGHLNSHPIIKKALTALKNFQQTYIDELQATATNQNTEIPKHQNTVFTHQQCCISPLWDTPWQITAILNSGIRNDHPALLKAGRWLISKQITTLSGDWHRKNPKAAPGGWSFEFENEYFPDVDDTIQVLYALNLLAIPHSEKDPAIERGFLWFLSMQNKDGGWAAFDKNQTFTLVNKIPFSDHGACLDPSSPDVTGRALMLIAAVKGQKGKREKALQKALAYIKRSQESFGGWFGRWGINYIYGTWCVLTGLAAIGQDMQQPFIQKAVTWLKSIQHEDGGFSESPESYRLGKYVSYPSHSGGVPSQTAWAIMGLIAAGESSSPEVNRGVNFLINRLNENGTWDEEEFTGTGFPGHFYIRYHGYRHYFPLMSLGLLLKHLSTSSSTHRALKGKT